ncbi:MAG TPA: helix-turn-helix domain-containing protein [Thermoleophilaceae bacterium]|jgi:AraC-like DNA-binding protein/NAD(P)H-dependent FMN reductase
MPGPEPDSVLVVGGSRPGPSRTRALTETTVAIVEQCGATAEVWDVGTAGRRPAGLRARAARAQALVLVTPTYHNSYSGLLKHALDQLDLAAVAGKPAALLATCGEAPTPQALDHLRIVLGALGATVVPSQAVAVEADFETTADGYRVADDLLLERVRAVVLELLWFARRLRRHGPRPPGAHAAGRPGARRNGELPDQIARAIEYIRRNYPKGRVPLDSVAREACMSRYHFSRTFKHATGTRFIDFVAEVRLAEARTLVAETDRSITSIAHAVGYRDVGSFERSFKKRLGMSPSEYRRRARARAVELLAAR